MLRKRKKYTQEFKQDAVSLVTAQGYSYAEAGRCLGINPNLLSRWKREQEAHGGDAYPGNGRLTAEQQHIRELEEQNRRLQMERDILKKATAFFAREST